MKMTRLCRLAAFLTILITLLPAAAAGQTTHHTDSLKRASRSSRWSVGATGGWAHLLAGDEFARQFVKSHNTSFYSLEADYRALPKDSSRYDELFGYPSISAGFILGNYSRIRLEHEWYPGVCGVGYIFAARAAFKRDVVNAGRFSLGYSLENGLGWCTRPYDGKTNHMNEFIGSPLSIYFGMGIYGRLRLTRQWELSIATEFKHFSNGALDRPNKGANTLGISAGARYYLQPVEERRRVLPRDVFSPYVFFDLSAGWDAETLLGEWFESAYYAKPGEPGYRTNDFRIYSSVSTHASVMARYSRKFASGIGLDYTYVPHTDALKSVDENEKYQYDKYSHHVLGIALRHEVYYKRMSMPISLGYYLYRKAGRMAEVHEKPYYETIGIRYYFNKDRNIYIGYHVKAHLLKAQYMELNVGIQIGGKRRDRRFN